MDPEKVRFGWITLPVPDRKAHWPTANTMVGENRTAVITETFRSNAIFQTQLHRRQAVEAVNLFNGYCDMLCIV